MALFKKLISPIQTRLMENKKCPGCFKPLKEAVYREALSTDTEVVFCACGRAFIYNRPHKRYRRALPHEVKPR